MHDSKEGKPLLDWRSFSGGPASMHMSQEEYLQTIASRLLFSRSCGLFYSSLLAASVVEVVWILHPWVPWVESDGLIHYPTSRVFFAVELYLTAGLIGETALRAVLQRAAFWAEWVNVFDTAVCVLSVLAFILGLTPQTQIAHNLEVVILVLLASWVALRLARLLTVARKLHRQRAHSSSLDVNIGSTFGDANGVGLGRFQADEEEGDLGTPHDDRSASEYRRKYGLETSVPFQRGAPSHIIIPDGVDLKGLAPSPSAGDSPSERQAAMGLCGARL